MPLRWARLTDAHRHSNVVNEIDKDAIRWVVKVMGKKEGEAGEIITMNGEGGSTRTLSPYETRNRTAEAMMTFRDDEMRACRQLQ